MSPEFLADRDLGTRVVVALRAAGVVVHTLPEVFGSDDAAQRAKDIEWIKIAGDRGWAAITKNKRIRYNTQEREAVARHRVALFALVNGNLSFQAMAGALLIAMPDMVRRHLDRAGGEIWIVHRDGRLEPAWPAGGSTPHRLDERGVAP